MAIHGYTWFYIAVHGNIWLYMAIHGVTWQYMVFGTEILYSVRLFGRVGTRP